MGRMISAPDHVDRMVMNYASEEAHTMNEILSSDRQLFMFVPWRFIVKSLARIYFVFSILTFTMAFHYVAGCYMLPAYGIMFYKHYRLTAHLQGMNMKPAKFILPLIVHIVLSFVCSRLLLIALGWALY